MKVAALFCAVALIAVPNALRAQNSVASTAAFPGDIGRPFNGLPLPENPAERRLPWPSMPGAARGPSLRVATQIAQGAAAACKGHAIGVSVIDSAGLPKLYYVTDGAAGYHAYTAFRKAYTALTFKMPTSAVGARSRIDQSVAARITADTNLLAFSGAVPIVAGGEVIGAVGVSGVEPRPGDRIDPGSADEKCAKAGLDTVRNLLK